MRFLKSILGRVLCALAVAVILGTVSTWTRAAIEPPFTYGGGPFASGAEIYTYSAATGLSCPGAVDWPAVEANTALCTPFGNWSAYSSSFCTIGPCWAVPQGSWNPDPVDPPDPNACPANTVCPADALAASWLVLIVWASAFGVRSLTRATN